MGAFAITVEFRLKPGLLDVFRPLMLENASTSLRVEPGCRRFEVLIPAAATDRVFLYEVYDDRAAFEAHLQTTHFKSFDTAVKDMIAERAIHEFTLIHPLPPVS